MNKTVKIIVLMSLMGLLAVLVAACGGSSDAPAGPNQVHMNDTNFVQTAITIKKGESVSLINDAAAVHIIENGTYDNNGNARPGSEPGAPHVDDNIGGNATQNVGPFNTAGTFHLYCTVHPGMLLDITVK